MKVTEISVQDYGIDHAQYFQGHGCAYTPYSGSALGAGDNPREALEEALEDLAQQGFTLDPELEKEVCQEFAHVDTVEEVPLEPAVEEDADETYYYVGLRFNVEDEVEVMVNNVGCVFTGKDLAMGHQTFEEYVALSKAGTGRCGHEEVTLHYNQRVIRTYLPPTEDEVMDDVNRCETDA